MANCYWPFQLARIFPTITKVRKRFETTQKCEKAMLIVPINRAGEQGRRPILGWYFEKWRKYIDINLRTKAEDGGFVERIRPIKVSSERGRRSSRDWCSIVLKYIIYDQNHRYKDLLSHI